MLVVQVWDEEWVQPAYDVTQYYLDALVEHEPSIDV